MTSSERSSQVRNKKTRISLITPPLWHYYFPQLSTPLLTSIMRTEGFSAQQYDLNIELLKEYGYSTLSLNEDIIKTYRAVVNEGKTSDTPFARYIEQFCERLCAEEPDIVGITFFRETTLSSLLVAKQIKEQRPETLVIGGGQYFSVVRADIPGMFNHFTQLDMIVCGEGDLVLPEIAGQYAQVCDGKSVDEIVHELSGIPNTYSAHHSPEGVDPTFLLNDLDRLPTPDFDGLPLDDYITSVFPVSWSRGCPMSCTFCDYHYNTFGTRDTKYHLKFRLRSPEKCVEDIKRIVKEYKVKGFFICDNLVNGDLSHLEKICQMIVEEELDIAWVALARIFPHTKRAKKLYDLMGRAGCRLLIYGVESACQKTLDRMNKKIKREWIRTNLKWCHEAGINANTQWILGFPYEQYEDARATIDFLLDNREFVGDVNLNPFSLEMGSYISLFPEEYGVKTHGFYKFPSETSLRTGSIEFENEGGISTEEALAMKWWLSIYLHKKGVLMSASNYLYAMQDFIKEKFEDRINLEDLAKKKREHILMKILKGRSAVKSSFEAVFPEKDLESIF